MQNLKSCFVNSSKLKNEIAVKLLDQFDTSKCSAQLGALKWDLEIFLEKLKLDVM